MVQPKAKSAALFAAFVLPALCLYGFFMINPFARGIVVSFTNWDGLTPRSPISMPRADFEREILSRVGSEGDRAYLLSVYRLDAAGQAYEREQLRGLRRSRVSRILDSIGYRPDGYRYVGLDNYRRIFSGGVDERFYPRAITKQYFNEDSRLPETIDAEALAGALAASPELSAALPAYYAPEAGDTGGAYALRPEWDEFALEDRIWLLPELASDTSKGAYAETLIASAAVAGLSGDGAAAEAAARAAAAAFAAEAGLSVPSAAEAESAALAIARLSGFKRLLSVSWTEKGFDLGVVGFTLFFAASNVVLANLFAFALALALDTKIKSRNALRSIFFLPNVLSMVVVALIWSFIFYNLLPALTGVDTWMGDPGKAPWLVVMVSAWQSVGYYMVIYLAGLQNVPQDVNEAAMMDGATGWKRLRYIVIPLLAPAFTICVFMSLANSLKCFDLIYAMVGQSGYALGTVPIVMDIFFDAFAKKMAGMGTAKAMVLFAVILLVTGLQLTVMKKREVES